MTKEEQWKREAEIKLDELDDRGFDFDNWSISDAYERGYCDCAEPREKRIAELEITNKRISDECHKLVDTLEKKQNKNELLETQNIKLQAEVSRLTIKNADLIGKIAFTENALNNAEAQIEKMKCCQNCKYFECCDSNHYYCSLYCGLECEYDKSYKNWEIKEND